jgi:hypothetical protein
MGQEGDESFDHLVGGHEQLVRHSQAERLSCFEIKWAPRKIALTSEAESFGGNFVASGE